MEERGDRSEAAEALGPAASADRAELEGPGLSNKLEVGVMVGLLLVMFLGMGFLISGMRTVHWGFVAGVALVSVFFFRGPFAVLRRYKTVPLDDAKHPGVRECVAALSRRAGLDETPDLRTTARDDCDAFSVKTPKRATIVLGDAVLEHLEAKHLEAVLAHEISHIRNRDTAVMGLADLIVRMTRTLSHIGLLLLVLNGVLTMLFDDAMPWGFITVLIGAPFLAKGVFSVLGRAREFRADRDAARLTGDPRALAEALVRFEEEAQPKRGVLRMLNPYGIAPAPSDIRTHPSTDLRVQRLMAMHPS